MRIKSYFIFFIWLFPGVCFAQDLQPFSARVAVGVTADGNIKGQIESYISRELRSLGDIIVTNDHPDWILNIVAMESKTRSGYKSGIVLSIVILEPFKEYSAAFQVDIKSHEMFYKYVTSLHEVSGHGLRTGSSEDLKSICEGIVADFDSKHLKNSRKIWQELIDMARECISKHK